MFNIIETPLLLIIIAVLTFLAHRVLRAAKPEKCPNAYLIVPVIVLALSFGIDYVAMTDNEKVDAVVKGMKKAAVKEDATAVENYMYSSYRDDYHRNRSYAISHLKSLFRLAPIKSAKIMQNEKEINGGKAQVKLKVFLWFEDDAPLNAATVAFSLDLEKDGQGKWLIASSEFLELNNRKIGWSQLP